MELKPWGSGHAQLSPECSCGEFSRGKGGNVWCSNLWGTLGENNPLSGLLLEESLLPPQGQKTLPAPDKGLSTGGDVLLQRRKEDLHGARSFKTGLYILAVCTKEKSQDIWGTRQADGPCSSARAAWTVQLRPPVWPWETGVMPFVPTPTLWDSREQHSSPQSRKDLLTPNSVPPCLATAN